MKLLRTTRTLLVTGTLLAMCAGGACAETYTITDLGPVGNANSPNSEKTSALNPTPASHKGLPTDLGTLGGTNSFGFGINDAGQVAGWSQTPEFSTAAAFLYSKGGMINLGTLGGNSSCGNAVNNAG